MMQPGDGPVGEGSGEEPAGDLDDEAPADGSGKDAPALGLVAIVGLLAAIGSLRRAD